MARYEVQDRADPFLSALGERVRSARRSTRQSRREIARRADMSERFLAQLEAGKGNISVGRLSRLASVLDVSITTLLAEEDPVAAALRDATSSQREAALVALSPSRRHGGRIALIGLRGAGKSTLGRLAAERRQLSFRELNDEIAAAAGISVSEVFSLYGQEGYRRLERTAIDHLAEGPPVILATGGGIVSEPATFDRLLAGFRTVWLRARPEEHMARVRAQGDERPMAGNPQAMRDLRAILMRRETDYARADLVVDTSGKTIRSSLSDLLHALELEPA